MTENLCPFVEKCGGCLYQRLSETEYLSKKENFVKRAFMDYGLEVKLEPIISVPLYTRRRASFTFAKGKLGYNAFKSHAIVEIDECRLLKPEIVVFLPTLRNWIKQLSGAGDVFVLDTPYGLDIHIKTTKPIQPNLRQLEMMAKWVTDEKVVRLTYNDEPIVEKVKLSILPDDFLQPSLEGEQILVKLVLENTLGVKTALDLFCGQGTFTNPLIKNGIKTKGYDCSASVKLLGENGVKRDLFRSPLLSEELNVDLVVLDPPRAGAKAQVEQLAETEVSKIVMVSCNPQTAARDCKILFQAGYRLIKITPVDQFKWSNHIELVCVLQKN